MATVIYFYTGIQRAVVAYHDIVADVCLGVDFYSFAYDSVFAYVGESSYVDVVGYLS